MACAKPSDCAPCNKCAESPAPVMPRCDIALTDGVYANAIVVVENGCIIEVQQGTAPLYTPDSCCAVPGGGGGEAGDGLDGDPGPIGPAAAIAINSVTSLPPGSAPTVVNVGSPTAVLLDIGIPRGEPGAAAVFPPGGATSSLGGIELSGGLVMTPLPPAWPPVLGVAFEPTAVPGVTLGVAKNDTNGQIVLTVDLTAFLELITNALDAKQDQIDDLIARVDALEAADFGAAIADHESRIDALETP